MVAVGERGTDRGSGSSHMTARAASSARCLPRRRTPPRSSTRISTRAKSSWRGRRRHRRPPPTHRRGAWRALRDQEHGGEPSHRGRGIGRLLIAAAVDPRGRDTGSTIAVATAAADVGNLRFYQRCGFRLRSVERDAFTAGSRLRARNRHRRHRAARPRLAGPRPRAPAVGGRARRPAGRHHRTMR